MNDGNLSYMGKALLIHLRLQAPTFIPRRAYVMKVLQVGRTTASEVLRNIREAGYAELRNLIAPNEDGTTRVAGRYYVVFDSPQDNLISEEVKACTAAGKSPFTEGHFPMIKDQTLRSFINQSNSDLQPGENDDPGAGRILTVTNVLPPVPPKGGIEGNSFLSNGEAPSTSPESAHDVLFQNQCGAQPTSTPPGSVALMSVPARTRRRTAVVRKSRPLWTVQTTKAELIRRHLNSPLRPEIFPQHRFKGPDVTVEQVIEEEAEKARTPRAPRQPRSTDLMNSGRRRDWLHHCEENADAECLMVNYPEGKDNEWTEDLAAIYVMAVKAGRIDLSDLSEAKSYPTLKAYLEALKPDCQRYLAERKLNFKEDRENAALQRKLLQDGLREEMREHFPTSEKAQLWFLSGIQHSRFVHLEFRARVLAGDRQAIFALNDQLFTGCPQETPLALLRLLESGADPGFLRSLTEQCSDYSSRVVRQSLAAYGPLRAIIAESGYEEAFYQAVGTTAEVVAFAIEDYGRDIAERAQALGIHDEYLRFKGARKS